MNKKNIFLILIFILSVVLTTFSAHYFKLLDRSLSQNEKQGDSVSYLATANDILNGDIWSKYHYRPPGYPVIIALFNSIFKGNLLFLRLFQIISISLLVFPIFSLANKIFKNSGYIASLWWAIYVNKCYHTPMILREWLLAVLFLLILWFLIVYKSKYKTIFSGFLIFYIIITDPRFLFILFLLPIIYFIYLKKSKKGKAKNIIIIFLISLILTGSWIFFDSMFSDRLVIVNTRFSLHFSRFIDGGAGPNVDKVNKGLIDISNVPAKNYIQKIIFRFIEYWRFANFKNYYSIGGALQPPWSLIHNLTTILTFGLFIPFLIIGVFWSIIKRNIDSIILLLFAISHLLIHLLVHSLERYRFQADAIWGIFIAYGVYYFFIKIKYKQRIKRKD